MARARRCPRAGTWSSSARQRTARWPLRPAPRLCSRTSRAAAGAGGRSGICCGRQTCRRATSSGLPWRPQARTWRWARCGGRARRAPRARRTSSATAGSSSPASPRPGGARATASGGRSAATRQAWRSGPSGAGRAWGPPTCTAPRNGVRPPRSSSHRRLGGASARPSPPAGATSSSDPSTHPTGRSPRPGGRTSTSGPMRGRGSTCDRSTTRATTRWARCTGARRRWRATSRPWGP
mmetsp:Transcript_12927/g.40837  ORF Transcript_12927/g.40837 Transcript_12927/m.40837 type:complete len:237 (+) Transcript_12927:660-1370(+)